MMDKMFPINITGKAMAEIKNIIRNKNINDDYGLRIGIKGAGCVGVSYLLGFDKKKDSDDSFTHQGLNIYIQKKDMMYLVGLDLDFFDKTDARGFTFLIPSSHPQEKS